MFSPLTTSVARTHRFGVRQLLHLRYSSSATTRQLKAIAYSSNGEPMDVLRYVSGPPLGSPKDGQLKIKFLLSNINPADLNVVEGKYPAKPEPRSDLSTSGDASASQASPFYIGGSEGVAQVMEVYSSTDPNHFKVGDWVIMRKSQTGTWINQKIVATTDVLRLPNHGKLTEAQAATISVNPATAFNMLTLFASLKSGDWVVQNGANSAVGQAVIQIAAGMGVKTINFVRERPDLDELTKRLTALGATHVATYDQLLDKTFRATIKQWTGGQAIKLGLNCIGGKETSMMAGLLGDDAHIVSYGAMSKAPLSFPTSLFIFKNLTAHGFWQSKWYEKSTTEQRQKLLDSLVEMIGNKTLQEPAHEIIDLKGSNAEINQTLQTQVLERLKRGRLNKKLLLRFEDE